VPIRYATSYSNTLDLAHLSTRHHWSILSSHRHACNLVADDGRIIALVDEAHGNGPFHLLVPQSRFDTIPLGASIHWQTGAIKLAHLTIDLQRAQPWNPQIPRQNQPLVMAPLSRYRSLATMRSPLYSGSPPLVERAQNAIMHLQHGVIQRNNTEFQQGVDGLVGLGPGLTPAGDDFLLGLLVAFTLHAHEHPDYARYGMAIVDSAAQASTRLSATWLAYAQQGRFGETWHRLIGLLNGGEAQEISDSVHTILSSGATSGADALCGFFVGNALTQDASVVAEERDHYGC